MAIPEATSRFVRVSQWLDESRPVLRYHRPLRTRLAVLVTGLVVGEAATVAGLAETVHQLPITPATEPSIIRRLQRLEADPRRSVR